MQVELIAITPNAEKIIEQAGRTCYLSFEKEKPGSEKQFIQNLIKNGHLSVLEHASATFRIKGCSRSFTHQLVRHRLASYSQQSQRFVDEKSFRYVEPPSIATHPEAHEIYKSFMEHVREVYQKLRKLNIPKEDARFVLPNATESEIVMTANFRELRHIINTRGQIAAQWEIRSMVIQLVQILQQHAPAVFGDYKIDFETNTVKSELAHAQ